MPAGKGYVTKRVGDSVATELKRRAGGANVSYNNTKRREDTATGGGKFGGLPGGPSGGMMNTGGKKRPGRPGPGLVGTG